MSAPLRLSGALIIAALIASVLGGCAAEGRSPEDGERERQEKIYQSLTRQGYVRTESVRRIPKLRIGGWSDIDSRTLIIDVGVSERYLLELSYPCPSLDNAFGIGLPAGTGSLTPGDSIVVQGVGSRLDRCPIKAIWSLEKLEGYDEAPTEDDRSA